MANNRYVSALGDLGGAIFHCANIPRRNSIIVCSAILAEYQDSRVKANGGGLKEFVRLERLATKSSSGAVDPGNTRLVSSL